MLSKYQVAIKKLEAASGIVETLESRLNWADETIINDNQWLSEELAKPEEDRDEWRIGCREDDIAEQEITKAVVKTIIEFIDKKWRVE